MLYCVCKIQGQQTIFVFVDLVAKMKKTVTVYSFHDLFLKVIRVKHDKK